MVFVGSLLGPCWALLGVCKDLARSRGPFVGILLGLWSMLGPYIGDLMLEPGWVSLGRFWDLVKPLLRPCSAF